MLEIIQAIVLGIVQGLTEFIPVSSSGHLVLIPWLLGWERQSLLFDTVLHWGTLISIIAVFWRELWAIFLATLGSLARRSLADPHARLGWFIVVGSIPAAVTGVLFKDFFEALFGSPLTVGYCLLITAALLAGSEQLARRSRPTTTLTTMNWGQAIIIGLAQAVALAPGISRSGSTMAAGLATGLRRDEAARFSFLLGSPIFFGAALLQLLDTLAVDPGDVSAQLPALIIGMVVSAVVGYLAIRGLLAYLRSRSLYLFAAYCLIVGLLVIGLNFIGF
ncbi:MAG: undecaprenyl-diphosphatase UppP [Caldilineaceae bacterium]|nr:undecaprenyl-diphosphatase UppP [Caldilineaceae bacterium]